MANLKLKGSAPWPPAGVSVHVHHLIIGFVPMTKLANRMSSLDGNLRLRRPGGLMHNTMTMQGHSEQLTPLASALATGLNRICSP